MESINKGIYMASEVRSGTSNPSYTNNTGQNVRIVINYMALNQTFTGTEPRTPGITLTWAGVSVFAPLRAIGRNLSFVSEQGTIQTDEYYENNLPSGGASRFTKFSVPVSNANSLTNRTTIGNAGGNNTQYFIDTPMQGALPTELMISSGQTFSARCGVYNIVIIPEAG
jgi:hypothetical protein